MWMQVDHSETTSDEMFENNDSFSMSDLCL